MRTENWKDIPNYEGIYAISDLGNIKRVSVGANGKSKPGQHLRPRPLKSGYLRIMLGRNGELKEFLIHRLVLTAFVSLPPFQNAQANHKNGVKNDNRLANLEWVTPKENTQHASKVLKRVFKAKHVPQDRFAKFAVVRLSRAIVAESVVRKVAHCN